MAPQPDKVFVGTARDPAHEQLRIDIEYGGELRQLVDRRSQQLRVRPDAVDRCRYRQRLAIAVGNGAAMRADLADAHMSRVCFTGEKLLLEHLQVDRADR